MSKARLEAFSDGVIAILITIMVLELRRSARRRLGGAASDRCRCFCSYVLSFVFLGIYWSNHHHMLQLATQDQRRDSVGEPAPAVLAVARLRSRRRGWARITSLQLPTAIYGCVLLASAIAYTILQQHDHRGTRTRLSTQGRGRATISRERCPACCTPWQFPWRSSTTKALPRRSTLPSR